MASVTVHAIAMGAFVKQFNDVLGVTYLNYNVISLVKCRVTLIS